MSMPVTWCHRCNRPAVDCRCMQEDAASLRSSKAPSVDRDGLLAAALEHVPRGTALRASIRAELGELPESASSSSTEVNACKCGRSMSTCPCFVDGFEHGVAYEDPEQSAPKASASQPEYTVEPEEGGAFWLASVPKIPGCMCYGPTPQEALQRVIMLRSRVDGEAMHGERTGRERVRPTSSMNLKGLNEVNATKKPAAPVNLDAIAEAHAYEHRDCNPNGPTAIKALKQLLTDVTCGEFERGWAEADTHRKSLPTREGGHTRGVGHEVKVAAEGAVAPEVGEPAPGQSAPNAREELEHYAENVLLGLLFAGCEVEYQPSALQGRWYAAIVDEAPRMLGSTPVVRLRDLDPAYSRDHHPGQNRTTVAAAALSNVRLRRDAEAPRPGQAREPGVSKLHELKTWPAPFEAIEQGTKHHEIRKNDRCFIQGDLLQLREWDPTTEKYTGRERTVRVSYVSYGGSWDLPDDICVMSIEKRLATDGSGSSGGSNG